jgi:hypothetical protein
MTDTNPPADRTAEKCTCFWTDPSTWTTHYGAVEPGSQREWNPECPEHGRATEELIGPDTLCPCGKVNDGTGSGYCSGEHFDKYDGWNL